MQRSRQTRTMRWQLPSVTFTTPDSINGSPLRKLTKQMPRLWVRADGAHFDNNSSG